jgi:hypothetical protein
MSSFIVVSILICIEIFVNMGNMEISAYEFDGDDDCVCDCDGVPWGLWLGNADGDSSGLWLGDWLREYETVGLSVGL